MSDGENIHNPYSPNFGAPIKELMSKRIGESYHVIKVVYDELAFLTDLSQNLGNYARKSENLADLVNTSTARSNLGLGSIATQNANAVNLTGGTLINMSDVRVAGTSAGQGDSSFKVSQTDSTVGITHTSLFLVQQVGSGNARTRIYAASPTPDTTRGQFEIVTETGSNYIMRVGSQVSGENALHLYTVANVPTVMINTKGNSYLNGGNVGIGTATPQAVLHVVNDSSGSTPLVVNKTQGHEIVSLYTGRARGTGGNYISFYDPTGRKGYIGYGPTLNDTMMILNETAGLELQSAQHMAFATGGSIRLRIEQEGFIRLTGQGYGSEKVTLRHGGDRNALAIYQEGAGDFIGLVMRHNRASGGTSARMMEFHGSSGTTVGTITSTGTATAFNTSSDVRLKENITPVVSAGGLIDDIEIVSYDWKVGGSTRFGVVAQDLFEVFPEAVAEGDDGEEIEKSWGVDYSKLVPLLIKEIQDLRARVATLE